MQSSGVGNCVNALALPDICRAPFLAIVSMARGMGGSSSPWQVPMGRATPTVLEAMGATVFRADSRASVGATVEAAANFAFNTRRSAAVLLSQKTIGAKQFPGGLKRCSTVARWSPRWSATVRNRFLPSPAFGSATWDLSAAGDDARNFCFIGAMGQGGALRPRPGDGAARQAGGAVRRRRRPAHEPRRPREPLPTGAPRNLAIVVFDNEAYVETGGQPTATAGPTGPRRGSRAVAASPGRGRFTEEAEIPALREAMLSAPGPVFVVVKTVAEALPLVFPHSFDGATAMNRFRAAATA